MNTLDYSGREIRTSSLILEWKQFNRLENKHLKILLIDTIESALIKLI